MRLLTVVGDAAHCATTQYYLQPVRDGYVKILDTATGVGQQLRNPSSLKLEHLDKVLVTGKCLWISSEAMGRGISFLRPPRYVERRRYSEWGE